MRLTRLILPAGLLILLAVAMPGARQVFAGVGQSPPTTPDVCTRLELHLQPGAPWVGRIGFGQMIKHMPLDPVIIEVPLYPKATNVKTGPDLHSSSFPVIADIKSAGGQALAPAAQAAVSSWYRQAFTRCGFAVQGFGYSGNRSGRTSSWTDFVDPSLQNGQVEVTYERQSSNSTLVLYSAWAVTEPPRPPSTIVDPGIVRAMKIVYYPPAPLVQGRPAKSIRLVITDQTLISDVASAVDSLTMSTGGIRSCPLAFGGPDTVKFLLHRGHAREFVFGSCGWVGTRGATLNDTGSAEDALGLAVYKTLYDRRAKH